MPQYFLPGPNDLPPSTPPAAPAPITPPPSTPSQPSGNVPPGTPQTAPAPGGMRTVNVYDPSGSGQVIGTTQVPADSPVWAVHGDNQMWANQAGEWFSGPPPTGGAGGEGGGGEEGGGEGFHTPSLPDLLSLQQMGFTPEQIASLLEEGLRNVATDRSRQYDIANAMRMREGQRTDALQRIGAELYSYGRPGDFVNSQDFKMLQDALFDIQADQIRKDAEAALGYIPNFSDPMTLGRLRDMGLLTDAEVAQMGDPNSVLATKVGSLQQQFADQGGLRANAGAYMSAYGNTLGEVINSLGQASSRASTNAYQLGLQGMGLANQRGAIGANIVGAQYSPQFLQAESGVISAAPNMFPFGQNMFNMWNQVPQQQFLNDMSIAGLGVNQFNAETGRFGAETQRMGLQQQMDMFNQAMANQPDFWQSLLTGAIPGLATGAGAAGLNWLFRQNQPTTPSAPVTGVPASPVQPYPVNSPTSFDDPTLML